MQTIIPIALNSLSLSGLLLYTVWRFRSRMRSALIVWLAFDLSWICTWAGQAFYGFSVWNLSNSLVMAGIQTVLFGSIFVYLWFSQRRALWRYPALTSFLVLHAFSILILFLREQFDQSGAWASESALFLTVCAASVLYGLPGFWIYYRLHQAARPMPRVLSRDQHCALALAHRLSEPDEPWDRVEALAHINLEDFHRLLLREFVIEVGLNRYRLAPEVHRWVL